jgi:hypothetical protein
VIFAHANQTAARVVEAVVRVANVLGGCDGSRLAGPYLAIHSLIGKIREIDDIGSGDVVAAAILVNTCA